MNTFYKIENGRLLIQFSSKIYDIQAISATAYRFTNQAHIFINNNDSKIDVYFEEQDSFKGELENIANKFCDDLIDQQVRLNTEKQFATIRDEIVKKAFSPIS